MEQEKQYLLNEILHENPKRSEDKLLLELLKAVERRKTFKKATSIASLAAISAVAIAFWQYLILGNPEKVFIIPTEPDLASIIETNANVEIIDTSSGYVNYIQDQPTFVNRIDDAELEKVFSKQAYAIVENKEKRKQFLALTVLNEELSF